MTPQQEKDMVKKLISEGMSMKEIVELMKKRKSGDVSELFSKLFNK